VNARNGLWQMAFGSVLIVRAVVAVADDVQDQRDWFGVSINVVAGLAAVALVLYGIRARRVAQVAGAGDIRADLAHESHPVAQAPSEGGDRTIPS
jgi:hypothetical protein